MNTPTRVTLAAACLLVLCGLPAGAGAAPGDDTYPQYEKRDTFDGWVEFLVDNANHEKAGIARKALANSVSKAGLLTASTTGSGSVDCSPSNTGLSQSTLIANLKTVGSKWKYTCPKSATITYAFNNPTKVPVFVRARFPQRETAFVAKPGNTSATIAVAEGCLSGSTLTSSPKFSPGVVAFQCASGGYVFEAAPVKSELEKFPKIMDETDDAKIMDFARQFPASPLSPVVVGGVAERVTTRNRALGTKVKADVKLGPEPAKLVDPRPYKATLTTDSKTPLVVTVRHEGTLEEAELSAAASVGFDLKAGAGQKPAFAVVAVRGNKAFDTVLTGDFEETSGTPRRRLVIARVGEKISGVLVSDEVRRFVDVTCDDKAKCTAVATDATKTKVSFELEMTDDGRVKPAGWTAR